MWASQVARLVKNLPVDAGDARDTGLIPGSGRPLRIGNGNHSSILAWKIRWQRSLDSHSVGQIYLY